MQRWRNVNFRCVIVVLSCVTAASWAVGPTICSATTASFWLGKTIFFQVGTYVPYRLGAPMFHICGEGTEWLLFLLTC